MERYCVTLEAWNSLWLITLCDVGICSIRPASHLPSPTFHPQPIPQQFLMPLLDALHARPLSAPIPVCPIASPFQALVWQQLLEIPFGKTRTYSQIARAIGKPHAARAVGAACAANPIPFLIPCHRVLAADGSLGGFSLGLPLKRRLLEAEKSVAAPPPDPHSRWVILLPQRKSKPRQARNNSPSNAFASAYIPGSWLSRGPATFNR